MKEIEIPIESTFIEDCSECGFHKETKIKSGELVTFDGYCRNCGRPKNNFREL